MCIYYGNNENLTYNSQEHIFPATIGGINKLPKGYVSDQANKYFSKLESRAITESFIGFEKMFFGPGNRGKDKPGRMPILLLRTQDSESMGFCFKGKPCLIPQIIISKNSKIAHISRDLKLQTNEDIIKLFDAIRKFNDEYTLIENKPDISDFIIGFYNKRLYISTKDESNIISCIEKIKEQIIDQDITNMEKSESKKEQPNILQNMHVDLQDDSRVFAKTAMNVLAMVKSNEYLKTPHFDKIKEWLIGKDSNEFKQFPFDTKIFDFLQFSDNIHFCIIMNLNGYLSAVVRFYNHWAMMYRICPTFDDFFNIPYVYFCDWQNHKEFTLQDHLHSLAAEEEKNIYEQEYSKSLDKEQQ